MLDPSLVYLDVVGRHEGRTQLPSPGRAIAPTRCMTRPDPEQVRRHDEPPAHGDPHLPEIAGEVHDVVVLLAGGEQRNLPV